MYYIIFFNCKIVVCLICYLYVILKNDVILLLRNSLNVIFVYCSYFDEFYMCVYVFSEVVC